MLESTAAVRKSGQCIFKKNIKKRIKGNVQRKLRWVESGIILRVWASHRGAGYFFVVLSGLHLVFTLFPFPVSTAKIMGEFWKNRCSGTSDLAPIVLAL